MTREEKLVEALQWCSGASVFAPGGKARRGWLKICAPLIKESRPTVRAKRPVQQRKQYICPNCSKSVWYSASEHRWRCCMGTSCGWKGKRPAVA